MGPAPSGLLVPLPSARPAAGNGFAAAASPFAPFAAPSLNALFAPKATLPARASSALAQALRAAAPSAPKPGTPPIEQAAAVAKPFDGSLHAVSPLSAVLGSASGANPAPAARPLQASRLKRSSGPPQAAARAPAGTLGVRPSLYAEIEKAVAHPRAWISWLWRHPAQTAASLLILSATGMFLSMRLLPIGGPTLWSLLCGFLVNWMGLFSALGKTEKAFPTSNPIALGLFLIVMSSLPLSLTPLGLPPPDPPELSHLAIMLLSILSTPIAFLLMRKAVILSNKKFRDQLTGSSKTQMPQEAETWMRGLGGYRAERLETLKSLHESKDTVPPGLAAAIQALAENGPDEDTRRAAAALSPELEARALASSTLRGPESGSPLPQAILSRSASARRALGPTLTDRARGIELADAEKALREALAGGDPDAITRRIADLERLLKDAPDAPTGVLGALPALSAEIEKAVARPHAWVSWLWLHPVLTACALYLLSVSSAFLSWNLSPMGGLFAWSVLWVALVNWLGLCIRLAAGTEDALPTDYPGVSLGLTLASVLPIMLSLLFPFTTSGTVITAGVLLVAAGTPATFLLACKAVLLANGQLKGIIALKFPPDAEGEARRWGRELGGYRSERLKALKRLHASKDPPTPGLLEAIRFLSENGPDMDTRRAASALITVLEARSLVPPVSSDPKAGRPLLDALLSRSASARRALGPTLTDRARGIELADAEKALREALAGGDPDAITHRIADLERLLKDAPAAPMGTLGALPHPRLVTPAGRSLGNFVGQNPEYTGALIGLCAGLVMAFFWDAFLWGAAFALLGALLSRRVDPAVIGVFAGLIMVVSWGAWGRGILFAYCGIFFVSCIYKSADAKELNRALHPKNARILGKMARAMPPFSYRNILMKLPGRNASERLDALKQVAPADASEKPESLLRYLHALAIAETYHGAFAAVCGKLADLFGLSAKPALEDLAARDTAAPEAVKAALRQAVASAPPLLLMPSPPEKQSASDALLSRSASARRALGPTLTDRARGIELADAEKALREALAGGDPDAITRKVAELERLLKDAPAAPMGTLGALPAPKASLGRKIQAWSKRLLPDGLAVLAPLHVISTAMIPNPAIFFVIPLVFLAPIPPLIWHDKESLCATASIIAAAWFPFLVFALGGPFLFVLGFSVLQAFATRFILIDRWHPLPVGTQLKLLASFPKTDKPWQEDLLGYTMRRRDALKEMKEREAELDPKWLIPLRILDKEESHLSNSTRAGALAMGLERKIEDAMEALPSTDIGRLSEAKNHAAILSRSESFRRALGPTLTDQARGIELADAEKALREALTGSDQDAIERKAADLERLLKDAPAAPTGTIGVLPHDKLEKALAHPRGWISWLWRHPILASSILYSLSLSGMLFCLIPSPMGAALFGWSMLWMFSVNLLGLCVMLATTENALPTARQSIPKGLILVSSLIVLLSALHSFAISGLIPLTISDGAFTAGILLVSAGTPATFLLVRKAVLLANERLKGLLSQKFLPGAGDEARRWERELGGYRSERLKALKRLRASESPPAPDLLDVVRFLSEKGPDEDTRQASLALLPIIEARASAPPVLIAPHATTLHADAILLRSKSARRALGPTLTDQARGIELEDAEKALSEALAGGEQDAIARKAADLERLLKDAPAGQPAPPPAGEIRAANP